MLSTDFLKLSSEAMHRLIVAEDGAPRYIVSADGDIIFLNDAARNLLAVGNDTENWPNFLSFYENPADRNQLLSRAHDEQGAFVTATIPFLINGSRKWITIICTSVRPSSQGLTWSTGLLLPGNSEHETITDVLETQSNGVFEISKRLQVVDATEKFRQLILGNSGTFPIELASLIESSADFDRLKADLENGSAVPPARSIAFRCRGGVQDFYLLITPKKDLTRKTVGFWGSISAPPRESLLASALDVMAVGLYEVRHRAIPLASISMLAQVDPTEQRVSYFNATFSGMIGLSEEVLVNYPSIDIVFGDTSALPKFLDRLVAEKVANRRADEFPTELHSKNGSKLSVTLSGRLVLDGSENIIGRIVVVRRLTEEETHATAIARKLTHDVGAVLHNYGSTLQAVAGRVEAAVDYLTTTTSVEIDELGLHESLHKMATELLHSLQLLYLRMTSEPRLRDDINTQDREQIGSLLEFTQAEIVNESTFVYALANIRAMVPRLLTLSRSLSHARLFSHETTRDIERVALSMYHAAVVHSLRDAYQNMKELDITISNMRSFMTDYQRYSQVGGAALISPRLSPSPASLALIFAGGTSRIADYAASKGVSVRMPPHSELRHLVVQGDQRDLARALENILHNAVKYSWSRSDKRAQRFVGVSVSLDGEYVAIHVENYGVPITEAELKDNLIFRFGYRGVKSSDRNRPGTGVGLADTESIIKRNGGAILVESTPVKFAATSVDKRPNITKVSLLLKRHRGGLSK